MLVEALVVAVDAKFITAPVVAEGATDAGVFTTTFIESFPATRTVAADDATELEFVIDDAAPLSTADEFAVADSLPATCSFTADDATELEFAVDDVVPLSADDEVEPVEPFPASWPSDDEPAFVVDDSDPLSIADDEFAPVQLAATSGRYSDYDSY